VLRAAAFFRALRHPAYRRWAGAGLVSVTGTWLQVAAQAWLVLQLAGSGTVLGLAVSLQAVPGLVLGPWAGSLADRLPRRSILLASQLALVALALVQSALAATGHLAAWTLLAAAPLTGFVLALEGPAAGALGASLVPEEDLSNAIALGSIANSVGRVVGVAAGGVVVGLAGPAGAFLVNAVSFLPVIAVLLRLAEPARGSVDAATAPIREAAALLRRPDLSRTIGLQVVLGSLGRNYQVTMAVMAASVFGAGSGGYAALSTAFAAGALAGGFAAARIPHLGATAVLAAGGIGAVVQLASSASPSLAVFGAAVVAAAVAAVVFDTAVGTHLQVSSPDELRGRVLGIAGVASALAGVVGGTALGWLAEHLGGRGALAVGGAACLVAVAVAAPGLRGRHPEERVALEHEHARALAPRREERPVLAPDVDGAVPVAA
jgi:MFS family permease